MVRMNYSHSPQIHLNRCLLKEGGGGLGGRQRKTCNKENVLIQFTDGARRSSFSQVSNSSLSGCRLLSYFISFIKLNFWRKKTQKRSAFKLRAGDLHKSSRNCSWDNAGEALEDDGIVCGPLECVMLHGRPGAFRAKRCSAWSGKGRPWKVKCSCLPHRQFSDNSCRKKLVQWMLF